MNPLKKFFNIISKSWSRLAITSKVGFSLSLFLAIVLFEAAAGYYALTRVWDANNQILSSDRIQRLGMGVSTKWERLRRLRHDFFAQSPVIGADQAYQEYGSPASVLIAEIIHDDVTLKNYLVSKDIDTELFNHAALIEAHLAGVSALAQDFQTATDNEISLSASQNSLQSNLGATGGRLLAALTTANAPDAILTEYFNLKFIVNDFFLLRTTALADQARSAAAALRRSVLNAGLSSKDSAAIFSELDQYETGMNEIFTLGKKIEDLRLDMNDQEQDIENFMLELLVAVNNEIEAENREIGQIRHASILIMLAAMVLAVLLAVAIAILLQRSLTRKIIHLTQVARQLEDNNLSARARIDSADELGELAAVFNDMAANLGRQIDSLSILHDASLALGSEMELDNVLRVAVDSACKLSNMPAGFLALNQNETLILTKTSGLASSIETGVALEIDRCLILTDSPKLPQIVFQTESIKPDCTFLLPASKARILVPLVRERQILGLLILETEKVETFQNDSMQFLSLLAANAAEAIHNTQEHSKVQRQAVEDALTGLLNRRGLMNLALREMQRAIRLQQPISVLFFDIDHFKQFNDQYSYEVGDQVLQMIGRVLTTNARKNDIVSRYGGEEFVIVLPDIDTPRLSQIAERFRKCIEQEHLNTIYGALRITASLGAAVWSPGLAAGNQAEAIFLDLLEEAGRMLHKAKEAGRNRVAGLEKI